MNWNTTGDLHDSANFWAIKVESWPQWRRLTDEISHVEDACFENNWICTTNKKEVQKWFTDRKCRRRGVAELKYETRKQFLGFLRKCDENKHWFGNLKIVQITDENQSGGPIEGVAIYSGDCKSYGKAFICIG